MLKMKVEPNKDVLNVLHRMFDELGKKYACSRNAPGTIIFVGTPPVYVVTAGKELGQFEVVNVDVGASVVSEKYDDLTSEENIKKLVDWAVSKVI